MPKTKSKGAAAPSTADDAAAKHPRPQQERELGAGELLGLNDDGSTFVVPRLPNTVETFLSPWQWNFSTLLTMVLSALTVYVSLTTESILWAYGLSLFWRLMYNAFLGFILNVQSRGEGFTRLVQKLEQSSPAMRRFMSARLSKAVAESTLTVRSWVHFRLIATTVLDLDVVAFLCVVYREFQTSVLGGCEPKSLEYFCVPDYVAYPVAVLLVVTSLYGKLSAHRTLGHYAWFWGDFFFRIKTSLTFDGIFELFPHPMYTAGYAWMYGLALAVRSYALFALVIICHLLQMAFLSLVETPHIEKIYGRDEPATGAKERVSNFFAPKNFDFFRAGDLSSVLVAFFFASFCALGVHWAPDQLTCGGTSPTHAACVAIDGVGGVGSDDDASAVPATAAWALQLVAGANTCRLAKWDDYWCNTTDGGWGHCNCGPLTGNFFVANAIFWRIVQTVVTGLVLHRQARHGWWTRHFEVRGHTAKEAFSNWVQVQNLLSTTTYISFAAAAWYLFQWSEPVFSAYGLSMILTAMTLIFVSVWTFQECYNVLGDFGWYYGDFFLPNPRIKDGQGLSYVGIYRYINNPSTVLGFLGFYAVALLCQSWTLASVAGVSQALHVLLVATVEEPHTKNLYTSQVRKELAHVKQLKAKLAKAKAVAQRGLDRVKDVANTPRRRRGSSTDGSTGSM